MQITPTPEYFIFQFPYKPSIVRELKSLHGRWNPEKRVWTVPRAQESGVKYLADRYHFKFTEGQQAEEEAGEIPSLPELTIDIPLKRDLFAYQRTGVAYGLEKKRVIVGDEMGLGKTAQAIAIIEGAHKMGENVFPCLIECPNSLKYNWQKEIQAWTNRKVLILDDRVKNTWPKYYEAGIAQYFIVNYESLKKYFVQSIDKTNGKLTLKNIKFKENINLIKSVIVDECHRVKSFQTQQTKFTRGICKDKEWVIMLTGTPVVNSPKDLLPQLGIMGRDVDFGGYQQFMQKFCSGPKEASNLAALNFKLRTTCFYRREKKDVLTDLPAKMRQVIYCDIDNRKEYNDAMYDLERYLKDYKQATDEKIQKSMRGEIMVRIGILKQISARGKLNDVFEFIDDTLQSGEKLGMFAHQHVIVDALKERYQGVYCITGREDLEQRNNAVNAFQNDPNCKLLILGIKAAGVGITLTAGSRCGFIELGWNPAEMDQCEDRFHRIGQVDSVQCSYFLGKDTIDEWVYNLIQEKRAMVTSATGASDDVEVNIIDKFINIFNQQ